jgi:hypothetical protein
VGVGGVGGGLRRSTLRKREEEDPRTPRGDGVNDRPSKRDPA